VWLNTCKDPTWNKLLGALKCPSVGLSTLANKMQQMIEDGGKVFVIITSSHWSNTCTSA